MTLRVTEIVAGESRWKKISLQKICWEHMTSQWHV